MDADDALVAPRVGALTRIRTSGSIGCQTAVLLERLSMFLFGGGALLEEDRKVLGNRVRLPSRETPRSRIPLTRADAKLCFRRVNSVVTPI